MINRTIHGYTIKRLIGTGGMADVYYAENSLGFPAAVKALKQEYSQHKSVKERFVNEAKIMTKLNHPHIRKVMDMGELEGRPCIIMEYLEGKSLKEAMQSAGRIGDATLMKYFDQCAQALKYTHSMDITHRDIKPSNIFITNEDDIKLFDFGIAKSELSLSQTVTGQTLGTVMYMSPEQVVDPKRVTVKTDVYSLGVTFYHALVGKPPYDIDTGSEFVVMRKIVDEDLEVDLLPAHWRELISSCLQKKPEDRIALKEKNFNDEVTKNSFNDEVTVVDIPSPPSEPGYKPPSGPLETPSWINYLLGALLLSIIMFALWYYS